MKTYVKEIEGYIVPSGATHYTQGRANPINAFYKRLGDAVFYTHSIRHDWLLEDCGVDIPENSIELPPKDTTGIIKNKLLSGDGLATDKKIINCKYHDNDFLCEPTMKAHNNGVTMLELVHG